MNEQELVARLKNREEKAYIYLIHLYGNQVLNTCFGFLKSEEDARDLSQEVFIEVFTSIRSFRSDARLLTWIYRISVNKSLDAIRRINRKKRFGLWIRLNWDEKELLSNQMSHSRDTPLSAMIEQEQSRLFDAALQKLPESQRVAWTLHKLEDFPQQQVAEIMDISVGAVESLIHRAKKNLFRYLGKYVNEDKPQDIVKTDVKLSNTLTK